MVPIGSEHQRQVNQSRWSHEAHGISCPFPLCPLGPGSSAEATGKVGKVGLAQQPAWGSRTAGSWPPASCPVGCCDCEAATGMGHCHNTTVATSREARSPFLGILSTQPR